MHLCKPRTDYLYQRCTGHSRIVGMTRHSGSAGPRGGPGETDQPRRRPLVAISTSRSAISDRKTRTWDCRNPTSTNCRPHTWLGDRLWRRRRSPTFTGKFQLRRSLGQKTIAPQQLLRAFQRFTNVALFRDNVADSEYEALQMKLEKRFSRGCTP